MSRYFTAVLFSLFFFSAWQAASQDRPAYGVCLQVEAFLSPGSYKFDEKKFDAAVKELVSMNAEWVRIVIDWRWVQQTDKTAYEWNGWAYKYDYVIDALASKGIKILAVLAYAPEWAHPGHSDAAYPPDKVSDYGDFVTAAATRYKNRIRYWEIWNEPNIPIFWKPSPDVKQYMALLTEAYSRIHAVDTDARVLVGGPANAPSVLEWFREMYALGLKDKCDIISMHPYVWYGNGPDWEGENGHAGSMLILGDIKKIMDAHCDGNKPVWLTEFGWEESKVGEDMQARYLKESRKMTANLFPFVENTFWFEFIDRRMSDGTEGSYGLLKNSLPPFTRRKAASSFPAESVESMQKQGE